MHGGVSRKGEHRLYVVGNDTTAGRSDEERDLLRRLARLLVDIAMNPDPVDGSELPPASSRWPTVGGARPVDPKPLHRGVETEPGPNRPFRDSHERPGTGSRKQRWTRLAAERMA
jgi:hypothetical protein